MDFGCSGLLVDEVTMRLSCVEDYGGEIIITLMGSPGHKRLRYAVGKKVIIAVYEVTWVVVKTPEKIQT